MKEKNLTDKGKHSRGTKSITYKASMKVKTEK